MRLHSCEGLLAQVAIDPCDIEIHGAYRLDDKIPLEFLGNMLDNSILGFYMD